MASNSTEIRVCNCSRDIFDASGKKECMTCLQQFLMSGIDINSKDSFGSTPLHCAILYENKEIVVFLLQHNADPNSKDQHGENCLHHASCCGDVPQNIIFILDLLLKFGAEINAKDNGERIPLHYAVENCVIEPVAFLLEKGEKIIYLMHTIY